ncbi:MAG: protein kinase [Polyangiaceae bacterium]
MPLATPLPPPRPEVISLGPDRAIIVGELVGRGNFSAVYRGVVEGTYRLRRPVAVKIFDPLSSEDREQVIAGLARATRHSACVKHPNVASPEEFVLASSSEPAIISEWVEGVPLERFVDEHVRLQRRIPTDLALFIALEAAEGLAGARDAFTPDGVRLNMGHHGLSSREILLSVHGDVKVTDFGLALALRPASAVLPLRSFARRVTTLPPEIAHGSRGDARSDVFALGMLLREMLVGPRFSPGTSDANMLDMVRDGLMDSSALERHLPEPISSILARSIEIEPKRRYPHAGLFADDLRRACAPMGVGDGRVFLRQAIDELFTGEHIECEQPTVDFGRDSGARLAAGHEHHDIDEEDWVGEV